MIKNLTNNIDLDDTEPSLIRFISGIIVGIVLSFTLLTFSITSSPYLSELMLNQEMPISFRNFIRDILFFSRILMVFGTGYIAGRISGGFYLMVGLLSNSWLLAQQVLMTSNFLGIFMITFLVLMLISSVLGAKIGQQRYQYLSLKS